MTPPAATLNVLRPGLHTRVVDHGRPGCRSLGVPVGGAADRFALAVGNALVGNPPDAAALEITLAGPTLVGDADLACVVYGAPFDLARGAAPMAAGTTFTLHAGQELHVGGTTRGMRAYFCVRGGLDAPVVLGSRSGFEPVAAGARLGCHPGRIGGRSVRIDAAGDFVLRALDGAQAGWFPEGEFFGQRFVVTPASDRMGLRLNGPPLTVPDRELVSEPVCPGTVQVTRDGQCIVLGVDGQTIGGYPKFAQVITADLDRLAQLRPGQEVRFQHADLAEAERLYQDRQAVLREWVSRLRAAEALLGPLPGALS
jgi:antagonist of KipI